MREILAVSLLSLFLSASVSAQPPETGYIGLFADHEHSINELWNHGGMHQCTLYVFCLPSERGTIGVEYALDYPDNVVTGSVIQNDLITLCLGDLNNGISCAFAECQTDWCWTHAQVVFLVDSLPSRIDITKHLKVGTYQFANCMEGYPVEPVYYAHPLYINSHFVIDNTAPSLLYAEVRKSTVVDAYFDEPLFASSAEDESQYTIFELNNPDFKLHIRAAQYFEGTIDPPGDTCYRVTLLLNDPVCDNVSYTLQVGNIRDSAGNLIDTENEVDFTGLDTERPRLMNVQAVHGSIVEVSFNEPVSTATAEDISNYTIIRTSSWMDSLVITAAALAPEGKTVNLSLNPLMTPGYYYRLYISNVTDIAGNKISDNSLGLFMIYDLYPPTLEDVVFLSYTRVDVTFNEPIQPETADDLDYYSMFETGDTTKVIPIIKAVPVSPGLRVKLTLGSDAKVNVPYTLRASNVKDHAGNIIASDTEMSSIIYDGYPPIILKVIAPANDLVEVSFSEELDASSAKDKSNYELYETENMINAIPIENVYFNSNNIVVLSLSDLLVEETNYTLHADSIFSTRGGEINQGNIRSFVLQDPPDLPSVTYCGLYLDEERSISALIDPSDHVEFAVYVWYLPDNRGLKGAKYEIAYPNNIKTMGVINGPLIMTSNYASPTNAYCFLWSCQNNWVWTHKINCRLINDEESYIRLRSAEHAGCAHYWEPAMLCSRIHLNGDFSPPEVLSASSVSDSIVFVTFDEPLSAESVVLTSNYTLYEKENTSNVFSILRSDLLTNINTVKLKLADNLENGIQYSLNICNVSDIRGNKIVTEEAIDFLHEADSCSSLLETFHAGYNNESITLTWKLLQMSNKFSFIVKRACKPNDIFENVTSSVDAIDTVSFCYQDFDIEFGQTYQYRVEISEGKDVWRLFDTQLIEVPMLPVTLYQNYPNPFNPSTIIRYYLPKKCYVTMNIFDVTGKQITKLIQKEQNKGFHVLEWDGKDNRGNKIETGIYFYRLVTGSEKISKKMVLIR